MRWVVGVDLVMGLVEVLECSSPLPVSIDGTGRSSPIRPLVARGQLDRAAVRMAVNPDGENGRWKGKTLPGEIRKGLETA